MFASFLHASEISPNHCQGISSSPGMFRAENKLSLVSRQCYEQFSESALLCFVLAWMGLYTHRVSENLFAAYVHRDTAPHIYQKENFWCFQIFSEIHFAKALFLVQKASGRIHRLSEIRISNQLGFFLFTLPLLIRGPWNAVFGCLFLKLQPREDRRICFSQHKGPESTNGSFRSQAIKIRRKQFSKVFCRESSPTATGRAYLIE